MILYSFLFFNFFLSFFIFCLDEVKVEVSHSQIAEVAVGVWGPLYLGHSSLIFS